jgi:hypothetical protein
VGALTDGVLSKRRLEERVPETEHLGFESGKPGYVARAFGSKRKGGSNMILILVGLLFHSSVTIIIVWRKRRR